MAGLAKRAMIDRMRLFAIFLFAALAGAAVACSGGGSPAPTPVTILTTPVSDPTATPIAIVNSFEGEVREFEVNLALNGSSQQGTAVFTRKNDFAVVEIRLRPGVPVQTVTLRRGTCPNPEGFEEEFNQAIGGVMRQELRDIPFDDLLKGNRTLVVNTSDKSFNEFAACADLPTVE